MATVPLTEDERKRFCEWMEGLAASDRELIGILESLPGPDTGMLPILKMEIAACVYLSNKLRKSECVTVEK